MAKVVKLVKKRWLHEIGHHKMVVALARSSACRCQLKSLTHTQNCRGEKEPMRAKALGLCSLRRFFLLFLFYSSSFLSRSLVGRSERFGDLSPVSEAR